MAPSHSSPPPKKPCVRPPNWLELPADVSASILRRLGAVEILTRAQHVCSTWRRICRDPSMWASINIGRYGPSSKEELYCHAVDLSSGGLLDLNVEFTVSLDLTRYFADRSNHLKRLGLAYSGISDHVMIELAGKFPFLEELELSHCYFSSEVVAAFGRLCPRLHSFKLNNYIRHCPHSESDDEAFAIAKHMPGLHHLRVFGNKLTDAGLIAILDGCQQLESLDLRRCLFVSLDADLERRCTQRIKHFHRPNDSPGEFLFDRLSDSDDSDSDDSDDSDHSGLHFLDFMAEILGPQGGVGMN